MAWMARDFADMESFTLSSRLVLLDLLFWMIAAGVLGPKNSSFLAPFDCAVLGMLEGWDSFSVLASDGVQCSPSVDGLARESCLPCGICDDLRGGSPVLLTTRRADACEVLPAFELSLEVDGMGNPALAF